MLKKIVSIFFCCVFLMSCREQDECVKDYNKLERLVSYGEIEDNVTLQLHDMLYACGECLDLYRVDKIIYSENKEYNYYYNKEITISILNKKLENKFNRFVCRSGKFYYVFSGGFRRNSLGGGQLDVTDGNLVCDE